MNDILRELEEQNARLRNPDLLVGYRERTQIERLLFLVLREYCLLELNYDLRGLTPTHRMEMERFLKAKAITCRRPILLEGFAIGQEIRDLQARDPYADKDSKLITYSDRSVAVNSLASRITSFISNMREPSGEQGSLLARARGGTHLDALSPPAQQERHAHAAPAA